MRTLLTSVLAAGLVAGTVMAGPGAKGNNHPAPTGGPKNSGNPMPGSGQMHKGTGGSFNNFKPVGDYHLTHGKSFSGGFYYPGKSHSHWTYWGYSQKYGCTCYWCPSTCCYYYWYPAASCYYPISYYQSAPIVVQTQVAVSTPVAVPTPAPLPVQAQTQTQTQTQTQVQGPPVGVPPLP